MAYLFQATYKKVRSLITLARMSHYLSFHMLPPQRRIKFFSPSHSHTKSCCIKSNTFNEVTTTVWIGYRSYKKQHSKRIPLVGGYQSWRKL